MFNLFRKASNILNKDQENLAGSNIVDKLVEVIDEKTDQIITQGKHKADQIGQHIDNTAQQVKTKVKNKLEEYTKLGKRLKQFDLPFAKTETNFIQKLEKMKLAEDDASLKEKLTQEIQKFKALYHDYDADIETLFGKLKFRGIIENEYDIDASEDIDKIDNRNKILRRLDIILALNNDAWWDKLFKHNQDINDNNFLVQKKEIIKQIINKDGIYLALSTESLYQLHMHYRTIIDALKEEQSTVEECKQQLGSTCGARWELYLKDMISQTTEEIVKINKVIIDRLSDSSTKRHSVIEDDRVQWICRDLLPYLPASEKLFHQFANKRPRLGMYQPKFQYFVKHFSTEDFQAFSKVMPADVLQHVKTSGFWEKLPNWLTSGRRQRANFIANHLYDLKNTNISANNVMNTQYTILRLDDISNVNRLESILNAEKSYDRLIQQVEKEKPRGLWASLFNQETQQMFDKYLYFLKSERNKIEPIKKNFVKQLNDFSNQDVSMIIENMSATGNLRQLLKDAKLEPEASTFFNRTDFLKTLLNEIVSPGPNNMMSYLHGRFPKVADLTDLMSTVKNFTKNQEQIEALEFVQDLIVNPINHLQADVTYLQLRLKPLSDLADSTTHAYQSSLSATFFDKLVTNWIQPRCLRVHSIEFQFLEKNYPEKAKQWTLSMGPLAAKLTEKLTINLKRWPQLTADEKKLIYNSFNTMLDFSWHQSVNYYQEYVNIIKKNLQHIPDDELDAYAELIDHAKNSKLKLLYQVKQLKAKEVSVDEVMEFILQIRQNDNIKITFPLDEENAEWLYGIVMPYQPAWQAQQELLIRQFAHDRLSDFYADRLIAGLASEKEENIHSDLEYAYPPQILTLIYGSKNYQRLLNVFDQCLEKNCSARQLKIMANFLPTEIEKCVKNNASDKDDPAVVEQVNYLRMRIRDKIEFNKIKALYDQFLPRDELIRQVTKLIQDINSFCPGYPLTSEGRLEFQQLIGVYDPVKAKQQSLFYRAFADISDKRAFFTAWSDAHFKSQLDKIIDVLPDNCTADDIISSYQQDDAFYLNLYQSIRALLELRQLPRQLTLIKKHLPIGMADKFINKELNELVVSLQSSIDESVFLSELGSLHHRDPMVSIEDINQFITKIPVYPDEMKTPFIANKYKAVVTQSVLPYDTNWKEQQKLLLTAIAPEHLPTYYCQWLKGLIQGNHQDININPIRSTDSVEMIFFHYGKFENNEKRQADGKQQLINVILPMIRDELKKDRTINLAAKDIIMRHVPKDLETHYQREDDKAIILDIRNLLNETVLVDEIDNNRIAELSRMRTRQLSPRNTANQGDHLKEIASFIEKINHSTITFPKSRRGKREFNNIIKFEETQKQISIKEKWELQQELLVKHFAPQHLSSFYYQWMVNLLESKVTTLFDFKQKTTCQDLEGRYGKDNLSQLLLKINDYVKNKNQINYQFAIFLLAHLPQGIETYHATEDIEIMRRELNDIVLSELEQLIKNKSSQEEVAKFIQAINSINIDILSIPCDKQASILAHISNYQPEWNKQQQLLLSSFSSTQPLLSQFYQSWFSGLLKGEHHDLSINPLTGDQDVLVYYGYTDNASAFIEQFLPMIEGAIKKQVNLEILSIIKAHLQPFKDSELVKPFIKEIEWQTNRIENLMTEMKKEELNLVNAIESYENIYYMHRQLSDHPELIFAQFALEKLGERAIAAMKRAIVNDDHDKIEMIHALAIKSDKYFPVRENIFRLYRDRGHIKHAWETLVTQISIDTKNNTKFKTLSSELCIEPTIFEWLDLVPKEKLSKVNMLLLDFESKLKEKDDPLRKYYQAIQTRLEKGKSFESEDDWKLITERSNFMMIIDFTKSIKKKKMLAFDLTDLKQKAIFDDAIEKVLQSPYQPSKMNSFWSMLLSPYLKKMKVSLKKSAIANNLKYIEKLIAQVEIEKKQSRKTNREKKKLRKLSDGLSNKKKKIKDNVKQKKKQVAQNMKQVATAGLHKLFHHNKPVNDSIMDAPINKAPELSSDQITNKPLKLPVNDPIINLEVEAAKEIRAYIALRESKGRSLSIYKKDSKKVKICGATKMVNLLENKPIDAFTKDEINALKESRLGEIIDKYKNLSIINESIYAEKQTKKHNY